MFGRLFIKTVEFAMWLAELAIDPHKLSICFSNNLSNSVDTSIKVRDALVTVLTVSVDLVSGWDIPSLSVGEVSKTSFLALSIVCSSMGAFNKAGERFTRALEHARLITFVTVVVMAVWLSQWGPDETPLMVSSSYIQLKFLKVD